MRHLALCVVAVFACVLVPTEARACARAPFCHAANNTRAIMVTRTVLPSHDILAILAPYDAPFHVEVVRDGVVETPALGNAMPGPSEYVTYGIGVGHLRDDDRVTIVSDCAGRHVSQSFAVSTIPAGDLGDLDGIAIDRVAVILGFVLLAVGAFARPRIAVLAIPDRNYLRPVRGRVRLPRARIHRRRP